MPTPMALCRILPLPDDQVSLLLGQTETLRWHFGHRYPRPFFFPLQGPSGLPLTRMGHPGAPNHDHHRSIWFAHQNVAGIDFWSDQTLARIRQRQWLAYEDDDRQAIMAVRLDWLDGQRPKPLVTQDLIAAVRPVARDETLVELHSTLVPLASTVQFGRTHFGFLAVRVAKRISAYFGGGQLTNSEGQQGEPAMFGQPARWVDYSGPAPSSDLPIEGITYFDHPANPGQPTRWHVREDGWMGASPCMRAPLNTSQAKPLVLRYLLHAHSGAVDADRAKTLAEDFAESPPLEVVASTEKHRSMRARRARREASGTISQP